MPNKRYESGVRFERRVMGDLAERGYYCLRSAGSHSMIDVVAIGQEVLLVQCKTDGVLSSKDKENLLALEAEGRVAILASRVNRKLIYKKLSTGEYMCDVWEGRN